jgi:nucleotidyltransferase/DNA polymerase involved in DNA repair
MSQYDRRIIIHVDMDAFFTSVEQRDFPAYRGKPVIVGADPRAGKGRGVVAAASYEARRYGIHSAQPISQAYRLCPAAVFLRGRYDRYAEVSESIMAVFREFTPLVEPISLDEAFLDVTGTERLFGAPEAIGRDIKSRVREKERLTASVGIGPNKLVAKIASDLKKPDGFVFVPSDGAVAFLAPLSVSKLWGVGKKTEALLAQLGIRTVLDLTRYSESALNDVFGKMGHSLWEYANGIDDDPVVPGREAKSISNETTFDEDQESPDVLQKTILALSEKVGFRLRREGLSAKTVFVKVRTRDFSTQVKRVTLPEPFTLSEVVYREALSLFRLCDLKGQKVRLIGVGVAQLFGGDECQTDLFETDWAEKRQKATRAVDQLKEKFGDDVIGKGEL